MSALPCAFDLIDAHRLAHVLDRRGAGAGDRLGDQRIDLGVGELRGQVRLDQVISAVSLATRSARPPVSKCTSDSLRLLIIFSSTS